MLSLDGSSQNLGVCGANVLWSDAFPDANPTYSWTNEGFYNLNVGVQSLTLQQAVQATVMQMALIA